MKISQTEVLLDENSFHKESNFTSKFYNGSDTIKGKDLITNQHEGTSTNTVTKSSIDANFTAEFSEISPLVNEFSESVYSSPDTNNIRNENMSVNIFKIQATLPQNKEGSPSRITNLKNTRSNSKLLWKAKRNKTVLKIDRSTSIRQGRFNTEISAYYQTINSDTQTHPFIRETFTTNTTNSATNIKSFTKSSYSIPENYTTNLMFSLLSALLLCICLVSIFYFMIKNRKSRKFWSSSTSKKLVDYTGPRRPAIMNYECETQSYHFPSHLCKPRPPTILQSDIISETISDRDLMSEVLLNFSRIESSKKSVPSPLLHGLKGCQVTLENHFTSNRNSLA